MRLGIENVRYAIRDVTDREFEERVDRMNREYPDQSQKNTVTLWLEPGKAWAYGRTSLADNLIVSFIQNGQI